MQAEKAPLPLLKWAGGKRQLLGPILARLPQQMDVYYEPFVGGAAVFFALAAEGRFRRAVLSDQNQELVDTYLAVKEDVEGVIRLLRKMPYSEEYYYELREQRPRSLIKRAARMIYLNRTGYNGLYRVNRSGKFNVPFGRYAAPKICDEPRLRLAAQALATAQVITGDFETISGAAGRKDAVYFDPPYAPVSSTARFSEYSQPAFGPREHERLRDHFEKLTKRGVRSVLSNSDTAFTREVFGHLAHEFVDARRSINSSATGRGPIQELLVFGPQRDHRARGLRNSA